MAGYSRPVASTLESQQNGHLLAWARSHEFRVALEIEKMAVFLASKLN